MDDIFKKVSLVHNLIIHHSSKIKEGQTILIEAIDVPIEFLNDIAEKILNHKAIPIFLIKHQSLISKFANHATKQLFLKQKDNELYQMRQSNKFIGLRYPTNIFELNSLPIEKEQIVLNKYIKPVHHDYRNNKIPWIYFRYPTNAMAQNAKLSFNEFCKIYYDAVLINYKLFETLLQPLAQLVNNTKKVRITGPGTELIFSVKDIKALISCGKHNLPDGEVQTAPIRESIDGIITFNTTSTFHGDEFSDVRLKFKNGKVIHATCNKNTNKLNAIISIDEGAAFIGEFALGVNPFVNKPINDILFDEKMWGSIHFALGNTYKEHNNGNQSCIHWDLILNQTKQNGGGEIYFDDILIRKDGLFVIPKLEHLNPEVLMHEIAIY